MHPLKRPKKNEQGAYAVVFAVLVVMLMTVAALAVDIGNAVARKSDTQGQADFAALAAGRASDGSLNAADKATIYSTVADSLNTNSPLNLDCSEAQYGCIYPLDLYDLNLKNGEVTFPDGNIKVTTPESLVDYAFAEVFGYSEQNIQASATVGLFSPGVGTLPMYAVSGCDYGPQTLTDPASGHATPILPVGLASSADTASATLTDVVTPNPSQIPLSNPAGPGPPLTLTGVDFHKPTAGSNEAWVTKIGFFLEDGSAPVEVPYDTRDETTLHIDAIPEAVATREDLWWIRVWQEKLNGSEGHWSAIDNAQPLRVGGAVLRCGSGSSEGNFGTLSVPRWDVVTADDLPVNIARGPDEPLTLAKHTSWVAPDGLCTDGLNNAVMSGDPNPGQNPGTNCLSTDPGLPAGVATKGLVTGLNTSIGFVKGRLDGGEHPTTACGRSNYNVDLGPQQPNTNNDILSCYLTNGLTLASVASGASPSGTAFEDDMYLSPRFAWVPVIADEPTCGGCQNYSIIDFRPAFITDETELASNGSSDVTSNNGLIPQGTDIKEVKVFFFNVDSLPNSTPGPVTAYLGVGPKIVRLID
jgi:Flp pilus assembly protein TadG